MREIKFRAWDKRDNIFLSPCNFHIDGNGQYLWQFGYEEHIISYTDLVVQQYTGLRDKNGVDIYEGDILQIPHSNMKSRVFFEDGCFKIENLSKICIKLRGRFEIISNNPLSQEVIGNIYENKDLIKGD